MKQESETQNITRDTILSVIKDYHKVIKDSKYSLNKLERLLEFYPLTKKLEPYKHRPAEEIIQIVNNIFNTDCMEKSRRRRVVDARHCAAHLLRLYTDFSYTEIGEYLGTYADHSTVISSCKKCRSLLEVDELFKEKYNICKEMIEAKFKIKV